MYRLRPFLCRVLGGEHYDIRSVSSDLTCRGIVELTRKVARYGALLRNDESPAVMVNVTGRVPFYARLITHIDQFFRGDDSAGVPLDESLEIMKMLEAADISSQTGKQVFLKDL